MVASLRGRGQRLAPAWAWLGTDTVVAPIGTVWPNQAPWWDLAWRGQHWDRNGMVPTVWTWRAPVGFNPDHGQEMSVG